ncbi:hypothetical protein DFH07DRAFT_572730 [Mycena maculata]|uniref:Secreted protein n=1 Tax=Mycena maculata TaxID=230809 RepID=A0AAD7N6N6_9AGAR|nr:hypothetical protein DFH07DRAFT_572730 [Mycena maculata]
MILSILFLAAWSPLHQMGGPRMSVIWDFFWEMDSVVGATLGQSCLRRRHTVCYRRPSQAFCVHDFLSISPFFPMYFLSNMIYLTLPHCL